jgi:hypothetical protein
MSQKDARFVFDRAKLASEKGRPLILQSLQSEVVGICIHDEFIARSSR